MQKIMTRRTISVDDDVHEALKRMGKLGETYGDVIRRLVEEKQRREKK